MMQNQKKLKKTLAKGLILLTLTLPHRKTLNRLRRQW